MHPFLEFTPNKLIRWILSFACCWKFLMKLFWMEVSTWMTEEGELCCIVSVQQVQTCTCVMRPLTRESHRSRGETKELVWGLEQRCFLWNSTVIASKSLSASYGTTSTTETLKQSRVLELLYVLLYPNIPVVRGIFVVQKEVYFIRILIHGLNGWQMAWCIPVYWLGSWKICGIWSASIEGLPRQCAFRSRSLFLP